MNESIPDTKEGMAVLRMHEALDFLKMATASRENSLAITKLEEAMMWSNKDRTVKGEFENYPTHVYVEDQ